MDTLDTLEDLAHRHRLARVEYRAVGRQPPSVRVVEPYAVEGDGIDRALRCRQIEPAPATGDDAWRWRRLRIDRIAGVADAGRSFVPQATPMPPGGTFTDAKAISTDPGEEYGQYVLSCLLDGKLTEAERVGASQVAANLTEDRRRAIHARVFAAALNEAALDGVITQSEVEYLVRLSGFLHALGWAPGTPA